jgi:AraC-like DNA-binding protein
MPAESQLRRQYISVEQGNEYRERLKAHLDRNRPFLKQRYTIRDLSGELGIPSYLLSAFINQEYGKNFSEFINDYRVDYLMDMAENDPNYLLTYTLEVIGQMGGFSSRTAFIAAVKRKTGKNPSEIFVKA